MKIKLSQLRKVIREAIESSINKGKCPKCGELVQLTSNGLVSYHDYVTPLGELHACPGSQNMPITSETMTPSNQLKDGGVVNSETGEILDMDSVPHQYLNDVEIDEMGYTTLPNDKFEALRGELKSLSSGKPKKTWKAPYQLNKLSKSNP